MFNFRYADTFRETVQKLSTFKNTLAYLNIFMFKYFLARFLERIPDFSTPLTLSPLD
jgi:hypothetical protein